MGTRDEFLSMIDFIESRNLKPVIDQVIPLEQINEGFQKMDQGNQFGKIVVKIA
jgi:D-arabinose 1-dehydrogenase-like Zn-dependent alcohol dehydrogenase